MYFISIGHILSIKAKCPKSKVQIREGCKSENVANEERKLSEILLVTMKKIIRNIGEEHVLFITT